MAGTKEDAQLIVQLAQWGAMMDLGSALAIVFDEQFDPETATTNRRGCPRRPLLPPRPSARW